MLSGAVNFFAPVVIPACSGGCDCLIWGMRRGWICAAFLFSSGTFAWAGDLPPSAIEARAVGDFDVTLTSGVLFGLHNRNNYLTLPNIVTMRWTLLKADLFGENCAPSSGLGSA
jgi:hypothetical protein